jgi:hypothetical protein
MEKGEEIVSLKITMAAFQELYNMGLIDLNSKDFKISRIEPHEVEYKEDPRWIALKEASNKAYKELKEYEYHKRHNGKNNNTSSISEL